ISLYKISGTAIFYYYSEMKQGLTLRSRCACFFEFPLLFFPSVRKERKPLPTLHINNFTQ
ncbi:hypothetical protein, partial [Klebsiella pneumoniae]|uniref:hypothetical protein n=1 Tax=Klebsiella pneumoniae TaxID=573 RepID=UPI001D0B1288